MRTMKFTTWAVAIALALSAAPAYALTIDDTGVVGSIDQAVVSNQAANPTNETAWANYLIDLGLNADTTVDAPGDDSDDPERYETNANIDYSSGTDFALGTQHSGTDVTGYTYVLAKYDGQNAGYVLFYVPDYGNTIPQTSDSIWTNKEGKGYDISHFTSFGSKTTTVPDGGATLSLLGLALGGLGAARRFMKS
jgi:hypothetical protein